MMLTNDQQRLLQNIISVYLQYQQYDKAHPLLQLQLILFPNEDYAYRQLSYLYYRQKQYELAIQCCISFQEQQSDASAISWPYLIKSFSFHKLERQQDAFDNYQRYIETRTLS